MNARGRFRGSRGSRTYLHLDACVCVHVRALRAHRVNAHACILHVGARTCFVGLVSLRRTCAFRVHVHPNMGRACVPKQVTSPLTRPLVLSLLACPSLSRARARAFSLSLSLFLFLSLSLSLLGHSLGRRRLFRGRRHLPPGADPRNHRHLYSRRARAGFRGWCAGSRQGVPKYHETGASHLPSRVRGAG